VAVLGLVISSVGFAQYTTGTVQGTILDPSGAVVRRAQVNLRNVETNAIRTFTTGEDGVYLFAAVTPGRYELIAEAKGFAKVVTLLATTSNGTVNQNVKLSVSAQGTTVTVEALAAEAFHTSDSQLDTTRSHQEIDGLPIAGRDLTTTFALEPGVQPMYTAGRGSLVKVAGAQTGLITANGGRPESSNVELDFTDANDWEFGGIAVGAAPVPDFVQELKLITSNPSAEFGVKSSGEIQFITKSGTNSWHGDGYDFLQNNAFNARDYFSPAATRVDQNNYGFSTGGALVKDKTFLFGGWEQLKAIGGGFSTQALVPTQAAINTVTDPVVTQLLKTYVPLPTGPSPNNDPDVGTVTSNFSAPTDSYQFLIRGDQRFSDKHNLAIRYFQSTGTSILNFPAFNTLSGFDSNLHNESRNANITDTYAFTPSTVNQLRLGYNRSIALLPPENGLESPRFIVAGLVSFGALPYFPQGRIFNIYQFNDVVSRVEGRHLLKFGLDERNIQDNSVNATNERGSFVFASLGDFLAGQLASWSQAFGPTTLGFRSNLFSLFAQDDYKLRPDLTINLGLRWEYQGSLGEAHGQISVLDPAQTGSIGSAGEGALGAFHVGNPAVNGHPANFAPRVGFAWNPRGSNLVVRGGYGIFWDSFTFTPLSSARTNPPLDYNFELSGKSAFQGDNNLDALVNVTAPIIVQARQQLGSFGNLHNFGSLSTVNRNLKNAYVQQYNLGFEYKLAPSTVASIAYVGAKGTHLPMVIPVNSVVGGPAPATSPQDELNRLAAFQSTFSSENGAGNNRLDPRFNQVNLYTDASSSSYNSLQIGLRHSLKYGLTLQGSYTWSKSIDDSSSSNPEQDSNDNGFPQNVKALHLDRAVSNFDVPNRIVVSSVWNVPFFQKRPGLLANLILQGWSFQTVNTWQSGIPGTILSGPVQGITDVNLDGNFIPNGDDNTRANFNPSGTGFKLNAAGSLAAQTQYSQPLLANNGTSGRNTVRLRNLLDFDWAFQKDWQLKKSGIRASGPWTLQFRTELYNAFNNPYLRPSSDNWRTVSSAGFGLLNSAAPTRNLQLALRLVW
jgi:hypothetical protein